MRHPSTEAVIFPRIRLTNRTGRPRLPLRGRQPLLETGQTLTTPGSLMYAPELTTMV